ncbi:MAG: YdcF family protein [Clostridiales bacterium]|nr:YdcF family protein [Clostridiales bacterium]
MEKFKKIVKAYLVIAGIGVNVFVVWMAAGWPVFFDRLMILSQRPEKGDYIVCLAGGLAGHNLPTEEGWKRIYTAVQLYIDGYGKKVIFTGGGASVVTEAEVYAEAAVWLGLPKSAVVLDPVPSQTSGHPVNILKIGETGVWLDSALTIGTSPLHSRRAVLCFEKAWFRNFRMVTGYVAAKDDPALVRELRVSEFASHRPSGKGYDDLMNRLRRRSGYFFMALREAAAIAWYRLKGYI